MPRIVYSLHFETERQPGEPITEFAVPLDRKGQSAVIGPVGKARVGGPAPPGDFFVYGPTEERYKLTAVSAYREHHVSDEDVASGTISPDAYLVPR